MTAGRPLWRAIIWIERFLPSPGPLEPDAKQASVARRRAALIPVLIVVMTVLPTLVRGRHELGAIVLTNRAALEQLMLVAAGCVAIAALGFGAKAWRAAGSAR